MIRNMNFLKNQHLEKLLI